MSLDIALKNPRSVSSPNSYQFISTNFQDLGIEEVEDIEEAVPLPNVTSHILQKVTEWAAQHKDDPTPPEEDEDRARRTDDISDWDKKFLLVCR